MRARPSNNNRATPVASASNGHGMLGVNADKQARRASRTDADFERALLNGETVLLHEGVDVAALGSSTSDVTSPPRRGSRSKGTPATPTVVPPTPRASDRAAQHQLHQMEQYAVPGYDPEEADLQTKRRSMFRSPGTASSPDLATLLRKARDRGGVVADAVDETSEDYDRQGGNGSLLTPARDASSRQRTPSSVSSNYSLITPPSPPPKSREGARSAQGPYPETPKTMRDRSAPTTPEWDVVSPRQRTLSKEGVKSMRATVKSKTSSFLGKMWGQGSVRDKPRSNTISGGSPAPPSSYNAPPMPTSFSTPSRTGDAPPVPPIPSHYRSSSRNASAASSTQDVFSVGKSSPAHMGKPLPPVHKRSSSSTDYEERADTVALDSPNESAPRTRPPDVVRRISEREGRRRSMSLGGVDWKQIQAAGGAAADTPGSSARHGNDWENTMKSFGGDFKLQELDTVASLNSPTSPTFGEAGHTPLPESLPSPYRKSFNASPTPSLPSVVLTESINLDLGSDLLSGGKNDNDSPGSPVSTSAAHSGAGDSPASESATVSPRSSSVRMPSSRSTTPQRSSIASVKVTPSQPPPSVSRATRPASATVLSNYSSSQHPSLVFGSNANSPESMRLRVQHRSVASTSEPSLINPQNKVFTANVIPPTSPGRLPEGSRTVRLLPSTPPTASRPSAQAIMMRRGSDNEDVDARGKELATRCWNEDETFLVREKIAEFLGGMSALSHKALQNYMKFYDFSALRLDHAFRRLCAKLYLKAETQQVDRILDEFSRRYFECNPNTIFGSASVVHAVSYSLLLLNTDLHVAELSSHMSRTQFVRNTMSVVMPQRKQSVAESDAPPPPAPAGNDSVVEDSRASGSDAGDTGPRPHSKRSGSMQSWKSISRDVLVPGAPLVSTPTSTGGVNGSSSSLAGTASEQATPTIGQDTPSSQSLLSGRNWEMEVETVLKEMYNAIKSQQILQPTTNGSMGSLSPGSAHNTLLRNRSQRGQQDRLNTLKRGSIRGIHALLGAQGPHGPSPYSSNSSLDGRISPSPSFATSMADVASTSSSSYFTPTLGFASNLSRTIIREAQEDDTRSVASGETAESSVSITDEELALHGPPWAKEGMLTRKQYWEATGKRSKNKAWTDVFAVISKGELKMFTFGEGQGMGAGVVGGGNWLTSAQSAGDVNLSHSLAHILPPPGYNRQRPHCFVLTLATGAVYFFQAGTEDLVNEWVSTCNYWAARQSKEPLAGGVSNMEYGWNRVSDAGRFSISQSTEDLHESNAGDHTETFSIRSGRSRMSKRSFADAASSMRRAQSPRDRIFINEWKPPIPSTVPSTHDEETQLEALQKQADTVAAEIHAHKNLQAAMIALYPPRSSSLSKAQANWERKSQHLLTELVKYQTYVESLRTAMAMRLKKRGEKALERALGSASSDPDLVPQKPPKDDPMDDPKTPVVSQHRHRREMAEDDEDDD